MMKSVAECRYDRESSGFKHCNPPDRIFNVRRSHELEYMENKRLLIEMPMVAKIPD